MGKTTAFRSECKDLEGEAEFLSARDLINLDLDAHPEWKNKTLYIDGLDEVRAGESNVRTPFDQIRARIEQLGSPKFRISCREADWLGENDRANLAKISSDGEIKTLQLDPLTYEDVVTLLKELLPDINAPDFVKEAVDRNIEGLLYNPQTLALLAEVVGPKGSEWPESRLALFERASLKLAQEHNEEHKAGAPTTTVSQLTDRAGQMCALMLITGKAGLCHDQHSHGEQDYIALYEHADNLSPNSGQTLSTKLFQSEGEGHFHPIHRHVAEFLAGRHLARLIGDGLPVSRVLSLLTGNDGIVVSELRGLSAWLAAICQAARSTLIERDPYGVGIYGDISRFSTSEKEKLLQALYRETSGFGYPSRTVSLAFGSIVTPELADFIKGYLRDPNREPAHQMYVVFLLEVMTGATPLPELFDTVVELVQDDTRSLPVRRRGIETIIESCKLKEAKTDTLRELVEDIRAGGVSDPENELLGTALHELYPEQIEPDAIWEYLDSPAHPFYIGSFRLFWERGIITQASQNRQDLPAVLDSLWEKGKELNRLLTRHHLEHLPALLFAHALERHGESIEPGRLYQWLSILEPHHPRSADSHNRVFQWLSNHPKVQKEIILCFLIEAVQGEKNWHLQWLIQRLTNVAPPEDLGSWCLTEALKASNSTMAKELMGLAVETLVTEMGTTGFSLDILFENTETRTDLRTALEPLLRRSVTQEYLERRKQLLYSRSVRANTTQESQLLQEVRAQASALRTGDASLGVLWELGNEYIERHEEFGTVLVNDQDLIDAALGGLIGIVQRDDIPDVESIIRTATESKSYYVSLSFLAGMAELGRSNPDQIRALTETQIRKALAFYYCDQIGERNADWYQYCLEEKPEMVAEVLEQCAEAAMQAGLKHIPGLSFLPHREDHSLIAKSVSISLLQKFAPNHGPDQMPGLDILLRAAIRHADRTELLQLILEKTSLQCMNSFQRIHWLAAGAVVHPEKYLEDLKRLCAGCRVLGRELGSAADLGGHSLLEATDEIAQMPAQQRVDILHTLVGLLGKFFGPAKFKRVRMSEDHGTQGGILKLIQELASSSDEAAGRALQALEGQPFLAEWHLHLEDARKRQETVRRDASFLHPSPSQVLHTLSNSLPANASDLASLVVERLEELADEYRNSNTDGWRKFWNEGAHRKVENQRHEDSCRDTLLFDLIQRLPGGIDGQPEGHYAEDKRADIKASYGGFNVPIEIKKNMHPDLWSALRDQLIKKYTRDPGADGFGIYLVFWFSPELTTPPPAGEKPATQEKLRCRLEEDLTATEARKVFVRVIDVSPPTP